MLENLVFKGREEIYNAQIHTNSQFHMDKVTFAASLIPLTVWSLGDKDDHEHRMSWAWSY